MTEGDLFKALFDIIPYNVYLADFDSYEILYMNKEMIEQRGNLVGRKCYKNIYGELKPCNFCKMQELVDEKRKPNNKTIVFELFNPVDDNWYQLQEKAIKWPDGKTVKYTIAVNIMELKETQNRLAEAHAQLALKKREVEKRNIQLEDFLAVMSHEIRTLMNGIMGMHDLLLETGLNNEQREYAANAREASELLLTLINDVLDYSKVEEGKLQLELINFDLASIERGILTLVQPKVRNKGLVLKSSLDSGMPKLLRGDPVRLRQVLLNLLSNAVKFTEKGEITLRAFPQSEDSDHITVRFEVRDTGIGIPEEARKNLFRPFSQANVSITRKYGGTGLGLYICKRLAELMDGKIGCESEEGRGSIFWFTVPLALGHAPEEPVDHQSAGSGRLAFTKWQHNPGTILVVEDFAINQKLILAQLKKLGVTGEVVSDGREAIAACARTDYALILMDCQIPGMDGFEATRVIRSREALRGRRIPIIATTANTMPGDREKCFKAGMDDYLSKPIRQDALHEVLSRWLPEGAVYAEAGTRTAQAWQPEGMGFAQATVVDTIKLKEFLQVVNGDMEFLGHLIDSFLKDIPAKLASLLDGLQRGDPVTMRVQAHGIKSSCAILGATCLSGLCQQLEMKVTPGTGEGTEALVREIVTEYRRVEEDLKAIRKNNFV